MIRASVPDVPIVLHSSHTEYRSRAYAEGFAFLQKRSPTFLPRVPPSADPTMRIRRFYFPHAGRHRSSARQ